MNEYTISKVYYLNILNSLKKRNKNATHKDVVEYLNQTAGILGGISQVKFL